MSEFPFHITVRLVPTEDDCANYLVRRTMTLAIASDNRERAKTASVEDADCLINSATLLEGYLDAIEKLEYVNRTYLVRINHDMHDIKRLEGNVETMRAEIESLKHMSHIYRERLKYCAQDIKSLQMRR